MLVMNFLTFTAAVFLIEILAVFARILKDYLVNQKYVTARPFIRLLNIKLYVLILLIVD